MTTKQVIAAAAVCILFMGSLAAKDHLVNVSVSVDSKGLDLSQPEGARKFYVRLKNAAWEACTRGNRVGLEPEDDPLACTEKSLAAAVRSARLPALTRIYLATHTLQQAEASGFAIPLRAAVR